MYGRNSGSEAPRHYIGEAKDFLRASPAGTSLKARDGQGNVIDLVTNHRGDLCYRIGKDIKLVRDESTLELLESPPEKTPEGLPPVVNSGWTGADYRRIATGLNSMIENVLNPGLPSPKIEEADLDDLETRFAIPVGIRIIPSDLAQRYFEVISASLNELHAALIKMGKYPKRINTVGEVRDIPITMARLKMLLDAHGMQFEYVNPHGKYIVKKIRVWQVFEGEKAGNQ